MGEEAPLPIVAEVTEPLWNAVRGGQAVVLTREGIPAVVALDLDTYAEWEAEFRECLRAIATQ